MSTLQKIISATTVVFLAGAACCENMSVVMVGNKVILESDVRAKMGEINKDYENALRELVVERMLVFQAEQEGIAATPEEVAFETARIKANFPDEQAFLEGLAKENLPYDIFVKKVEENIKSRKLVRKNITEKVQITIPEITAKMKELEEAGSSAYNVRMKWFEDEASAEAFFSGFDASKESDMSEVIKLSAGDIMPAVLAEIEKLSAGEISKPFKVGDRYLVVLLKDTVQGEKPDDYLLYNRAKIILQNTKFSQEFDRYLKELQGKIPVFYTN
ncbi:MAG: hypothetical protein JW957_03735 [Candidatus Omnitrophica bacterium]|nr:hypothetical protein [Candidatus Omnitrophota bacterium]